MKIAANDRAEVRFPMAAMKAGTARFQFGAIAGANARWADAAELALPVWTPATSEAFATYGTIDQAGAAGAVSQPIKMPDGVFPQFGGVEVSTSSTALQALTDAVIYLQRYPYECSEQMASRVIAIAALKDVLSAFKAEGLPPPEAMLASVKKDVEMLRRLQNAPRSEGPEVPEWHVVVGAVVRAPEPARRARRGVLQPGLGGRPRVLVHGARHDAGGVRRPAAEGRGDVPPGDIRPRRQRPGGRRVARPISSVPAPARTWSHSSSRAGLATCCRSRRRAKARRWTRSPAHAPRGCASGSTVSSLRALRGSPSPPDAGPHAAARARRSARSRPLRASDDPLGDGRLGDEEGAGDLLGGEPPEQPQGEGHAGLGGEDRVATNEVQPGRHARMVSVGVGSLAVLQMCGKVFSFQSGGELVSTGEA